MAKSHLQILTPEPVTGALAYKTQMQRLEQTLRWRQQRTIGDKLWTRAGALNAGRHWADTADKIDPTSDSPNDRITVNLTASTIQDFLPYLLRKNPEFIMLATQADPMAEDSAMLTSVLMNYYWQELRFQRQLRKSVLDGLVIGHGIMKTGYMLEGDFDEAANAAKHGKIELRDYVRKDEPLIRRVNPFKFLFDPNAPDRDLESARWAGEIFFMPLQDVLNNDRYSRSVRQQLANGKLSATTVQAFMAAQGDGVINETQAAWTKLSEDEMRAHELIVLVELWDKKFEKYYIFPWGVEKPLVEESWKFPYLDGFPYAKWDFIALNDEPYGLGIPAFVEDQQMELNRIRSTEYQHRRKHSRSKIGITENMIDPVELEKLTNNKDEVFFVKGPISQVMQFLTPPSLPADNYRVDATIKEDFRQLTGQDQLQSGGTMPSRTTAREIEAREGIIGLKAEERIQRVDDFVMEIGTQLLQHLQANVTVKKVVRIAGPEGQMLWRDLSPQEIKREYDMELVSTSVPEHDPMTERATRTQIYQLTLQQLPYLMQSGYMVNVPEMLTWTLEAYDMPRSKSARFIVPMPPPPPQPGAGAGPGQGPATGQPEGDQTAQQIRQEAPPPESGATGAMLGG
jgi:hypothetical protein